MAVPAAVNDASSIRGTLHDASGRLWPAGPAREPPSTRATTVASTSRVDGQTGGSVAPNGRVHPADGAGQESRGSLRVDRADRSAPTMRKTSRIACGMANSQGERQLTGDIQFGSDIGEAHLLPADAAALYCGLMGARNSSTTRVVPIFTSLFEGDVSGRHWLPGLLRLGSRSADVPLESLTPRLVDGHRPTWGRDELALPAPLALLEYLVQHITEEQTVSSGDTGTVMENRQASGATGSGAHRGSAASASARTSRTSVVRPRGGLSTRRDFGDAGSGLGH